MGLKAELSKMDLSVSEHRTGERTRRVHASGGLPAPTALMQGMAGLDELKERAARSGELEGRLNMALQSLSEWDGAKPTRLIDPANIVRSRFANRHELNFVGREFERLKGDIRDAGGNIQPISVRALAGAPTGSKFEIVFGHRRHQACLEIGLPVLAVVDAVDDRGLFCAMERENRDRKDLSAWEQGMMYRRALDEGLFPSNRKLAEAIGVDLGALGKALDLSGLDAAIVSAFPSPLDLQFRWAKPLKDALARDPDGTLARAAALIAKSPRPSARAVFQFLIDNSMRGVEPFNPPQPLTLKVRGKKVASLSADKNGGATLVLAPGAIDLTKLKLLAMAVENFLTKPLAKA